LREYLLSLRGRTTMVLVSHRPSLVRIADRHFQLTRGSLREMTGNVDDVFGNSTVNAPVSAL
jgi:ABC-type multidrug transport system fused ATPase/permease subunit